MTNLLAMLSQNRLYQAQHGKSQLSVVDYHKVAVLAAILSLVFGPFYAAYDILRQFYNWVGTLSQGIVSRPTKPQWNTRGYLERLPPLSGIALSNPETSRTPQSPADCHLMHEAVSKYIVHFAESHDQQYYLGRSSFISENAVMYAISKRYEVSEGIITEYFGQVCRTDLKSGSLQVSLHPADATAVVEAGWGHVDLRHPMVVWCERMMKRDGQKRVSVKLPSQENELEVIKTIVNAAAWWIGGIDSRNVAASFV